MMRKGGQDHKKIMNGPNGLSQLCNATDTFWIKNLVGRFLLPDFISKMRPAPNFQTCIKTELLSLFSLVCSSNWKASCRHFSIKNMSWVSAFSRIFKV